MKPEKKYLLIICCWLLAGFFLPWYIIWPVIIVSVYRSYKQIKGQKEAVVGCNYDWLEKEINKGGSVEDEMHKGDRDSNWAKMEGFE